MNEKERGALMKLLLRDGTVVFCVIPGPLPRKEPKSHNCASFKKVPTMSNRLLTAWA